MIVDKINAYLSAENHKVDEAILAEVGKLAQYAFIRQFGERSERKSSLRLSSIGKCLRQQAYNLLGYDPNGKEIDSRAKMVFFMGDLTEMAVLQLAKAAGCDISAYGDNQAKVELEGIAGHPDGLLSDSGVQYLVEVKSMSSYSFGDFERSILDDGYRYQCNAYMEALSLDKCVIVALNKDAGVLGEMVISKDPEIIQKIKERIAALKAVTKENLPERPYAPNAEGFYPWNCRYCSHYKTCLPNAQLVLKRNAYKLYEPNHKKGDYDHGIRQHENSEKQHLPESPRGNPAYDPTLR